MRSNLRIVKAEQVVRLMGMPRPDTNAKFAGARVPNDARPRKPVPPNTVMVRSLVAILTTACGLRLDLRFLDGRPHRATCKHLPAAYHGLVAHPAGAKPWNSPWCPS